MSENKAVTVLRSPSRAADEASNGIRIAGSVTFAGSVRAADDAVSDARSRRRSRRWVRSERRSSHRRERSAAAPRTDLPAISMTGSQLMQRISSPIAGQASREAAQALACDALDKQRLIVVRVSYETPLNRILSDVSECSPLFRRMPDNVIETLITPDRALTLEHLIDPAG